MSMLSLAPAATTFGLPLVDGDRGLVLLVLREGARGAADAHAGVLRRRWARERGGEDGCGDRAECKSGRSVTDHGYPSSLMERPPVARAPFWSPLPYDADTAEGWDPRPRRLRLLRGGVALLARLAGRSRGAQPRRRVRAGGAGLGALGAFTDLGPVAVTPRRLDARRRGLDASGFAPRALTLPAPSALPCAGVPGAFSWPGAVAVPLDAGRVWRVSRQARGARRGPSSPSCSPSPSPSPRRSWPSWRAWPRWRGWPRAPDTRPLIGARTRGACNAVAPRRGCDSPPVTWPVAPAPPTSTATTRSLAARPPAAPVVALMPATAPTPEPPSAEPSTAARRPAAGTTGSAIARAARWRRTAASYSAQPSHCSTWRRSVPRPSAPPLSVASCSRTSPHGVSRAVRQPMSAARAWNTSALTFSRRTPRTAAMSWWEWSPTSKRTSAAR